MATTVFVVGASISPPLVGPTERFVDARPGCFDATVTALPGSGIAGRGWLCIDDDGIRPSLHVNGLRAGAVYSAWLGQTNQLFADPPTSNGTIELRGGKPEGPLRRFGEGVVPNSGELNFHSEFRAVRLLSGGQVTLVLLHHQGNGEQHAQAVFSVP
jgi:hypothetical protein